MHNNLTLLITGGCGFIGSHIAEKLTPLYKKVIIVDNLITGDIRNIEPLLEKYTNVKFIYCDITNNDQIKKIFREEYIDQVCHQAALGSVPRSISDPLASHHNNVNGFLNVLSCCHNFGVKRFVYASSSSVYGNNENLPKIEDKVGDALSPYAVTKKIDELYANVFWKCYKVETIGTRYFNVFGPRQNPNGPYAAVIPKFIDLMKNNKQPTINGNGNFSRDFTYVDNVVLGNYLALNTKNEKAYGDVFNIAAGGNSTILELFNILKEKLNFKQEPIFSFERSGDIPHSHADITKAKNVLGFKPKIQFKEGIQLLIDYNNK